MSGRTVEELTEELARTNEALYLQEATLSGLSSAEHHGWWTDTGDIILIGDHGRFGPADGDLSDGQVLAIDGAGFTVRTVDGYEWRYADARALVRRGRLPRPEPSTDD